MRKPLVFTFLQLFVAPSILILSGHTPWVLFGMLGSNQTTSELLLTVAMMLIWAVWVWGVVAALVGLRYAWASGSVSPNLLIPAHLALATAAIAGAMNMRLSSHGTQTVQLEQEFLVDQDDAASDQIRQIAFATLAGFVLRSLHEETKRSLQRARAGMHHEPHSRLAQLVYRRLLAISRTHEPSQQLVSLTRDEDPITESKLNQVYAVIPLGYTSEGVISIDVVAQTVLRVQNASRCATFVNYLAAMTRITTVSRGRFEIEHLTGGVVQLTLQHELFTEEIVGREHIVEMTPNHDGSLIHLHPMGVFLRPFVLTAVEQQQWATLTKEMTSVQLGDANGTLDEPQVEPHDIVVKLMGPIEISRGDGSPLNFRKAKSEELLAWLVLHRERPLREIARTAIWDHDVQDSTFNNVLSELRRAIREALPQAEFDEKRHRKGIALPSGICTDVELLDRARSKARSLDTQGAWTELRKATENIRGLPFEGARYEWADAEGLTSHIVLKIMNACADLALHYLKIGDVDGVYFATSQGLRALPGNDEMLELRARALAMTSTVKS